MTSFPSDNRLYSTAGTLRRFLQMLLNGGELDGELSGVRALKRESVALMGENQSTALNARALKTADLKITHDFTFIADEHDERGSAF